MQYSHNISQPSDDILYLLKGMFQEKGEIRGTISLSKTTIAEYIQKT